jgi:hypothetical protein
VFIRNVGKILPDYTVSHLRRLVPVKVTASSTCYLLVADSVYRSFYSYFQFADLQ